MKTCRNCERLFEPRRHHYYLCKTCWFHQRPSYPAINLPTPLPAIPQHWLKRLIQLAYPDRHDGSKLAVEATQWLLSQRQESRVDG